MKKIINWIVGQDKDKILHFTLCLMISIMFGLIAKVMGGDKYTVLAVSWFAGFIAGVTKEIYDEKKSKSSDVKDWIADILGTTLGTLITFTLVA